MPSELDSLDDLSDTSSVRSDDSYLQALIEWEENLDQLRDIFGMVLLPLLGRYLGRKWSFWGACLVFFCALRPQLTYPSLRPLQAARLGQGLRSRRVMRSRDYIIYRNGPPSASPHHQVNLHAAASVYF